MNTLAGTDYIGRVKMNINPWTQLSVEYASQRNYLDDLFSVYPTIPEGIREPDNELWKGAEKAFGKRDNIALMKNLLNWIYFQSKIPTSLI